MSDGVTIINGMYFDGHAPVPLPVQVSVVGEEVMLTNGDAVKSYRRTDLLVTPRIGAAHRFVTFPDGGQMQCPDHPLLDAFPSESKTERPVAWLEERVGVAVASVLVVVSLLACGYFFGVPAAADWAVTKIPAETERSLGQQAITWLDDNKWFAPTKIDKETESEVLDTFSRLIAGAKMGIHYSLEFRSSDIVGANAFALPGGTIVITDAMILEAESDDEIAAVLAHEIAHVEKRHSIRQLLKSSLVAIMAAAVTNDASSFSVAVAGLPALLAQMKYSRQFETEADDAAITLLKKNGIPPEAFASLMERLSKSNKEGNKQLSFLSTHPDTKERAKRARHAGSE